MSEQDNIKKSNQPPTPNHSEPSEPSSSTASTAVPETTTTSGSTLDVEERRAIVELYQKGYGLRRIAERTLRDRKTVRRVLEAEGIDPDAHQKVRKASTASKLLPYHALIQDKVTRGLTVTRILREIREVGYSGGRTILTSYARSLRAPLAPRKPVKRRFETAPGEEMQVDWSVYTIAVGGVATRVHALACVLAQSRKLHVRFYPNERESTLLEGLSAAFLDFEGVTQRVVFDNMATVVLARLGRDRKPVWHPRMADFAQHHGFEPYLCKVRDPDRKGEVENVLGYAEKDFVRGTEVDSFVELNQRVQHWCDVVANRRVHGTTGQIPHEAWLVEKDFLIRLPEHRFAVHDEGVREVGRDATLSIAGTLYTVPAYLADQRTVAVRLYAYHFEVLDREGKVAFSRRYVERCDRGKLQIDPTHYQELAHRGDPSEGERLDERLMKSYPSLAELIAGIHKKMKGLAPIHWRRLWRLSAVHGDEAFLKAATRAQEYRRYSADAVRRILERDHPQDDLEPIAPLGATARAQVLLGEVEPGSLDSYGHLDTDAEDAVEPDPSDKEDDDHGE